MSKHAIHCFDLLGCHQCSVPLNNKMIQRKQNLAYFIWHLSNFADSVKYTSTHTHTHTHAHRQTQIGKMRYLVCSRARTALGLCYSRVPLLFWVFVKSFLKMDKLVTFVTFTNQASSQSSTTNVLSSGQHNAPDHTSKNRMKVVIIFVFSWGVVITCWLRCSNVRIQLWAWLGDLCIWRVAWG